MNMYFSYNYALYLKQINVFILTAINKQSLKHK